MNAPGPTEYLGLRPSNQGLIDDMGATLTAALEDPLTQAAHRTLIAECIASYQPGDIMPAYRGITFRCHDGEVFAIIGDLNSDVPVFTYRIDRCPKGLL